MQRARGVVLAVGLAALSGCQASLTDCQVLCAGERTGCPRDLVCGADGYCYGDQAAAAALGCSAGMISTDGASGVDDRDGGRRPDGSTGKRPDAATIDAMPEPDAEEPEPDAGKPGGCAADPSEPNGTLGTARATGIPPATRFHRTGLELCPSGETDLFKLRVVTSRDVFAQLTVEGVSVFLVELRLLNSAGTTVASSFAMPGTPGWVRQVVPTGDYYVQVNDGFPIASSRYEIDITSSVPPPLAP